MNYLSLLSFLFIVLFESFKSVKFQQSVNVKRGPPPDIFNNPHRGEGSENGIRLISKEECYSTVQKWYRTLGVVSGAENIDKFHMLLELEKLAVSMPGIKPQRIELISIGEFVDGSIDCIAGIIWRKNCFPNEIDVACLLQKPNLKSDEKYIDMIHFINRICSDNAIIPVFSSLQQSDLFNEDKYKLLLKQQIKIKEDPPESTFLKKVSQLYSSLNKSPSLYLDSISNSSNFGPYWFSMTINSLIYLDTTVTVPLYFRKKQRSYRELEILFNQPPTG